MFLDKSPKLNFKLLHCATKSTLLLKLSYPCYSKQIMLKSIEKNLANFREVQDSELDIVRIICKAYSLGAQNVSNLNGMTSITVYAQSRYEEPTDLCSIGDAGG